MIRRLAAALTLATTFVAPSALAQGGLPEFTNFVVDAAGVVPDEAEQRLNAELADYQRRSTNQIAIAVIETTGNRSIEDYTIDLAREWGVGRKGEDNGVLFLVAFEDRRMRIEVGRGLEDELTDLESGRIIRNDVRPRLQEGDVGGALEAAVTEIRRALGDTEVGEPGPMPQPGDDTAPTSGWARALPFLLVLPFVFGGRALLRGGGSSVFWGGGGVASAGRRRRYGRSSARHRDDDDDDGGGLLGAALLGSLLLGGGRRDGGWGGGGSDFGGGGGDLGGFGGGGGGDFGGGGASGDW